MTELIFLPPIDSEVPIPGFKGYFVTYNGDVISYKRGKRVVKESSLLKTGYCSVGLTPNGSTKQKKYAHHVIVAKTWLPNPKNAPTVNHIDCNKQNNCVSNLEWATYKEQVDHNIQINGAKNYKAVVQADLDGNIIAEFKSIKEAAEKTGVPSSGIGAVCKKRHTSSGGYIWFYKDDKNKKVRGHGNAKIVQQYTKEGVFVKEYPSCRAASDDTGIQIMSISNAARGKYKTGGNFVWKYKEREKTEEELLIEEVSLWKDVRGFSNYKISTDGRVFSKLFKIILKSWWRGDGFVVAVSKEKKSYNRYVHQLVALTYIPNPRKVGYVNHIDGNQRNNNVENLEWVTKQENSIHAAENGLLSCQKPVKQFSKDGEYIATYKSITEAAKALDSANRSGIAAVANGIAKSACGYLWEFDE